MDRYERWREAKGVAMDYTDRLNDGWMPELGFTDVEMCEFYPEDGYVVTLCRDPLVTYGTTSARVEAYVGDQVGIDFVDASRMSALEDMCNAIYGIDKR